MYFDGHVDLGAYGYIMHSNWDKHEVLVIDDSIFQDVQKLALAKEQFNISIDSGHHEPLTLMALLVLPDCQAVGHGSFWFAFLSSLLGCDVHPTSGSVVYNPCITRISSHI